MAEQTTTTYGFFYYDQFDIDWHTGLNNNWLNLDTTLNSIKQEALSIGSVNFLPHTLFKIDSNADGVPEFWNTLGPITTVQALQGSEIAGFASKYVATLDNSAGGTAVSDGLKITGVVPPSLDLTFSAYIKCDQQVKLQISNGGSPLESVSASYAQAAKVSVSGTIASTVASADLSIIVTVPAGAVASLEVQLPMFHVGVQPAAYVPSAGEMGSFLAGGDFYLAGALKSNVNFNQRKAISLRLEGRSADPSAPVSGQFWYQSDRNRPRFYDGSTAHDLSVAKATHPWQVAGNLTVATEVGGVFIVPQDLMVEKVFIYAKTSGSAGTTLVDINLNGTTLFTTQVNRPQLAYNDADKVAVSATPDVTALVAGDVVSLDIDQVATGVADLSVLLVCS